MLESLASSKPDCFAQLSTLLCRYLRFHAPVFRFAKHTTGSPAERKTPNTTAADNPAATTGAAAGSAWGPGRDGGRGRRSKHLLQVLLVGRAPVVRGIGQGLVAIERDAVELERMAAGQLQQLVGRRRVELRGVGRPGMREQEAGIGLRQRANLERLEEAVAWRIEAGVEKDLLERPVRHRDHLEAGITLRHRAEAGQVVQGDAAGRGRVQLVQQQQDLPRSEYFTNGPPTVVAQIQLTGDVREQVVLVVKPLAVNRADDLPFPRAGELAQQRAHPSLGLAHQRYRAGLEQFPQPLQLCLATDEAGRFCDGIRAGKGVGW